MTAVHQFVPSLAPRDAIGHHVLEVRRVLREMGIDSEIYVGDDHMGTQARARPYKSFGARSELADTWLLYHASTGSPIAEFLAERPEPLIIDYHNITPPHFFESWEPVATAHLKEGRRQLGFLAQRTSAALADSAYNRDELVGLGYRNTYVAPILLDLEALSTAVPDVDLMKRLATAKSGGGIDLVFVGRISPNKAQEDLMKMLAAYRRLYDPKARLHLIGGLSSHSYQEALQGFADALDLGDGINLAGSVTPGELAAYYRCADIFVTASEHEGFCVPLLEAMVYEVPIIAFAAGAVAETLGDCGLLLDKKDAVTFATAVAHVASDKALRSAMVARGLERLANFSLERSEAIFKGAITDVLALSGEK